MTVINNWVGLINVEFRVLYTRDKVEYNVLLHIE